MNAFDFAIDDLFADPNIAQTVLYRTGGIGDGVAVRAIARRPDREVGFGDIAVHTCTALFEVRVSEVPNPASGDSITLDGETFIVQGEPERDAERLIWNLDTRPA
ncbi:MAG: hypothetical protein OEL53_04335 [Rhodospirillales bacterium]|nr:hypothetical protein [Rhodospirillales bacterium]